MFVFWNPNTYSHNLLVLSAILTSTKFLRSLSCMGFSISVKFELLGTCVRSERILNRIGLCLKFTWFLGFVFGFLCFAPCQPATVDFSVICLEYLDRTSLMFYFFGASSKFLCNLVAQTTDTSPPGPEHQEFFEHLQNSDRTSWNYQSFAVYTSFELTSDIVKIPKLHCQNFFIFPSLELPVLSSAFSNCLDPHFSLILILNPIFYSLKVDKWQTW